MLAEICADENLPIGWIISENHHLSCESGHSYALTTKTMAVGNSPENDGPSDAFLATPVEQRDSEGNFTGWAAGEIVSPLPAPYNCPDCGLPLGIK